jgi:hypothetical protein
MGKERKSMRNYVIRGFIGVVCLLLAQTGALILSPMLAAAQSPTPSATSPTPVQSKSPIKAATPTPKNSHVVTPRTGGAPVWHEFSVGAVLALASEGSVLWVATAITTTNFTVQGTGLLKFDANTGSILASYTISNSSLLDNQVNAIVVDGAGNKWFGTASGVSEFNGTTNPATPTSIAVSTPSSNLASGVYTATLTFRDTNNAADQATINITLRVGYVYYLPAALYQNSANNSFNHIVMQNPSKSVAALVSAEYYGTIFGDSIAAQSNNCGQVAP